MHKWLKEGMYIAHVILTIENVELLHACTFKYELAGVSLLGRVVDRVMRDAVAPLSSSARPTT